MKYLDEYRDASAVRRYRELIDQACTRDWTLMEICGGQTHSILRHGLDALLPPGLTLIHGPGCPVCVTAAETIDRAIALAHRPEVTFCTFGDMLRVPGSGTDLLTARAGGADVRMLYAPTDALAIARQAPDRQVVLFAVGFETTAPATALAVRIAAAEGLENFSVLVAHVRVPPAMHALLAAPECRIDGFLAAGHVCTVMGYREYHAIVDTHRIPIVVTGFEPVDLMAGVLACVQQLEAGEARVENAYPRCVSEAGNSDALALLETVFEPVDRDWRGIGSLPASGLALTAAFRHFDAQHRFWPGAHGGTEGATPDPSGGASPGAEAQSICMAGEVLRGLCKPPQCPAFASRCTPEHPLGATMVSSEGACAAYYRYRRAEHAWRPAASP